MKYEDRDAELLDALLTARLAGTAPPPAGALPEEAPLAFRLVDLAAEMQPDPAFAAALGARLQAASNRRTLPSARRWRRLVLFAASLAILLGLLVVPQVRAAVLKTLRVGSVLIEQPEAATVTALPGPSPTPATLPQILQDLAGTTTLEEARRTLSFPIRLPTYPPDLGPPDLVYHQELGGDTLIAVWLDPQHSERARMALYMLDSDVFARKSEVTVLEETQVDGRPAVWIRGTHILQILSARGDVELAPRRLVEGNVLIWEAGGLTYRLESDLPLRESVRVAESLQ